VDCQQQRIQPLAERAEFEIRFPNVVRIESKFKPVLKLDLSKVDRLTLNAYDTREIAELAPVIEGKHDVTRLIKTENLRVGGSIPSLAIEGERKKKGDHGGRPFLV
jgi:type III restriction enzyme